jgi:hypothetical protein
LLVTMKVLNSYDIFEARISSLITTWLYSLCSRLADRG